MAHILRIETNGEHTHVCADGRTELTVAPGVQAAVRLVCAPGRMEFDVRVADDASLLLLVTGEADAETEMPDRRETRARKSKPVSAAAS